MDNIIRYGERFGRRVTPLRKMASRMVVVAFRSTSRDIPIAAFPNSLLFQKTIQRNYSIKSSSVDPPDVARLAQTARISLSSQQIQDFAPKIHQVVDWFGQLQAVDLENIEPAIRSDIDGDNLRGDVPLDFENKEAIIAAIPNYDEPYIKVPKVLNKE